MRLVHFSCATLRWVCSPTRTGSKRQYSHFRRSLRGPVDLILRRCSAGCARYVAIYRSKHNVTARARIVNMLNICLWASWYDVDGGLSSKTVRTESIVGALYNQSPPISEKRCGYVGNVDAISAPQWTSYGIASWDYDQKTMLAVVEHQRWPRRCFTLRLRWGHAV